MLSHAHTGTKQYSGDDPSDKKKRRQAKASATTSAKMGVRLGGVRVYKPYLKAWFEKKGDYVRIPASSLSCCCSLSLSLFYILCQNDQMTTWIAMLIKRTWTHTCYSDFFLFFHTGVLIYYVFGCHQQGKRLSESGFQEAVSFFLNDGRRTRTELIIMFIEKLKGKPSPAYIFTR